MVKIRRLEAGEEEAFARSMMVPFLDPPSDEDLAGPRWQRFIRALDAGRSWVAEDAGRLVGNCTVHTMDVTVPAAPGSVCPVLAMGGVSAVGVHPTHRRQGILTSMMTEMLSDCTRRGEPLAGLIASESAIYGRYGFGIATEAATATIDSTRSTMLAAPPDLALRVLDGAEAAKTLPAGFERFRTTRAGEPSMREGAWESFFADDPHDRDGASALMFAAGERGYVAYRVKGGSGHHPEVVTAALWGADAGAEAALWRYLLDIDLTDRVRAARRPLDEPLRWRLADPRQLRLDGVVDRLHLRILDMPAAFAGRGYAGSGRLVLDVVPPPAGGFAGDRVPGRWVIDASPAGASVTPAGVSQRSDLRLDVTALGCLYMGGFAASALASAGWIDELTPGALATADRMLLTRPLPLTVTGF